MTQKQTTNFHELTSDIVAVETIALKYHRRGSLAWHLGSFRLAVFEAIYAVVKPR